MGENVCPVCGYDGLYDPPLQREGCRLGRHLPVLRLPVRPRRFPLRGQGEAHIRVARALGRRRLRVEVRDGLQEAPRGLGPAGAAGPHPRRDRPALSLDLRGSQGRPAHDGGVTAPSHPLQTEHPKGRAMRLNFQELLRNPDTCRVRLSMRRSHEMRLSVRWRDICAGQERCISPKGALCLLSVTEKRSLSPTPHGKAHPATPRSRTLRPCVTLPPTGGCGANPPPDCGVP